MDYYLLHQCGVMGSRKSVLICGFGCSILDVRVCGKTVTSAVNTKLRFLVMVPFLQPSFFPVISFTVCHDVDC